jgi:GT2 family glycosyltransferase
MPGVTFSILTPVYDPPIDVLRETAESVFAQTDPDWEWVLVDDRSSDPAVRDALGELAAADERVRVIGREQNGGIVAASNDAIAAARGEFFVFLDNDDLLTDDALAEVRTAVEEHDDVDYVYSDEDKLYESGEYGDHFRKPDWSPERLRYQMYTSHLSVMRADLVRELGGFRTGYDGSQDHDLVLRLTERARRVSHIPKVLYHWRALATSTAGDATAKPWAWDAGLRAVSDHVARVGIRGTVRKGEVFGRMVIEREPDLDTPTSVIIPTRGTAGIVRGEHRVFVVEMVRSLVETTQHRDIEFVVVYDTGTPDTVLAELERIAGERLVLVEFTEVFNFSRKCNVGFLHARGDALVFMNDDMEAISPDAIEQLIAPLREPGVGATGARLLFEDTSHQHAGLCYGDGSIAHGLYRYPMDALGYADALVINREVSAITGACVAVTRQTFEEVGGFSESLDLNFNDVDFSLKVRKMAGGRLVWLENVKLFHFESVSRSTVVEATEVDIIKSRWGDFTKTREEFALPLWGPLV